MKRFHDRIYAISQKGLLIWEPSWETFRPVVSVVWNPINNQVEPFFGNYIHDIFDIDYGFGNTQMHEHCIEFTDENAYDIGGAEEITDIQEFWKWCGTKLKWAGDRWMATHPCSGESYRTQFIKRYNLRAKTCRNKAPRNLRSTRKISTH